MNTQDRMKRIISRVRDSCNWLEAMLESELSTEEKVEEFVHEITCSIQEIACSVYNVRVDKLARRLFHEQELAIINQEAAVVEDKLPE